MADTLRNVGLGLIAAWLLVLVAEHVGMVRAPWDHKLLWAGLALTLIGSVGRHLSGRRHSGGMGGGRCVRCNKRVRAGQIYCAEHGTQAIRQTHHEGAMSRKPKTRSARTR